MLPVAVVVQVLQVTMRHRLAVETAAQELFLTLLVRKHITGGVEVVGHKVVRGASGVSAAAGMPVQLRLLEMLRLATQIPVVVVVVLVNLLEPNQESQEPEVPVSLSSATHWSQSNDTINHGGF
jgi:hypothetical protein